MELQSASIAGHVQGLAGSVPTRPFRTSLAPKKASTIALLSDSALTWCSRQRGPRITCRSSAFAETSHTTSTKDASQFKVTVNSFLIALRKVFITAAFFATANRVFHGQGMSTLALLGIQLVLPFMLFKKVLRLSGYEALAASLAAIPVFWGALARFVPPQHMVCTTVQLSTRLVVPMSLFHAVTAPNPFNQAAAFLCGSLHGSGLAKWFYILTWLCTSAYCYTSLRLNSLNPLNWGRSSSPETASRSSLHRDGCEDGVSKSESILKGAQQGQGQEGAPVANKAWSAGSEKDDKPGLDWLHVFPHDTGYVPPPSTFHAYETSLNPADSERSSTKDTPDDWNLPDQMEFQIDSDDGPQLLLPRATVNTANQSNKSQEASDVRAKPSATFSGDEDAVFGFSKPLFSAMGDSRPSLPTKDTPIPKGTSEPAVSGNAVTKEEVESMIEAALTKMAALQQAQRTKLKTDYFEMSRKQDLESLAIQQLTSTVEDLIKKQDETALKLQSGLDKFDNWPELGLDEDEVSDICTDLVTSAIEEASESHSQMHSEQKAWNEATSSALSDLRDQLHTDNLRFDTTLEAIRYVEKKLTRQIAEVEADFSTELETLLEPELKRWKSEQESFLRHQLNEHRANLEYKVKGVESGSKSLAAENRDRIGKWEEKLQDDLLEYATQGELTYLEDKLDDLIDDLQVQHETLEKDTELHRTRIEQLESDLLASLDSKINSPSTNALAEEGNAANTEAISEPVEQDKNNIWVFELGDQSKSATPVDKEDAGKEQTAAHTKTLDSALASAAILNKEPLSKTNQQYTASTDEPEIHLDLAEHEQEVEDLASLESSTDSPALDSTASMQQLTLKDQPEASQEQIPADQAQSALGIVEEDDLGDLSQLMYGPWGPVREDLTARSEAEEGTRTVAEQTATRIEATESLSQGEIEKKEAKEESPEPKPAVKKASPEKSTSQEVSIPIKFLDAESDVIVPIASKFYSSSKGSSTSRPAQSLREAITKNQAKATDSDLSEDLGNRDPASPSRQPSSMQDSPTQKDAEKTELKWVIEGLTDTDSHKPDTNGKVDAADDSEIQITIEGPANLRKGTPQLSLKPEQSPVPNPHAMPGKKASPLMDAGETDIKIEFMEDKRADGSDHGGDSGYEDDSDSSSESENRRTEAEQKITQSGVAKKKTTDI